MLSLSDMLSGSGGSVGGLPGLPNPLQLVGSALGIILNFASKCPASSPQHIPES